MRSSITKILLLLTSLAISACAPGVPQPPAVWQCQFNGTPRAFFCVNIQTKERMKLAADEPSMKGAQCMSAQDYKKSEAYVKALIELAKTRCQ